VPLSNLCDLEKFGEEMEQTEKLKPINWGLIYSIVIVTLVIFLFALTFLRTIKTNDEVGRIIGYTFWVLMPFYIYFWFKTKQFILLPTIGFFTAIIFMNFGPLFLKDILAIISLTLSLTILYLLFSAHKYTLLHRKILELAAKPVDETADGFTQRPFPVDKIVYQKGELNNFANFLKKHKIAIPIMATNNAIFCFPDNWYNRKFHTNGNYLNDTRIIFNSDGNVTTAIAKRDYQRYKEELTFDQLCAALGNLFISFLKYYQNGNEKIILEKIKNE